MKKTLLALSVLFLVFGFIITTNASDNIYTKFVDQGIVYAPGKAYYPTVVYTGSQYLMLADSAQSAVSVDGSTWTDSGSVIGLTNPKHMVMLYDSNKFGGGNYNYKIWYWDTGATIPNGANSIRYAESMDGINWENDRAVFGGNMIVNGDDNVDAPARTWGPGTVIYNSGANNIGSNPLNYSYVMYYDGYNGITDDLDWDNTEALFLAYSSDGINWNRYTKSPVLKGGSTGEWDNGGVGYPTVMQIEDSSYVMWYSGGSGTNKGIGFATSPDAINWTKDSENPIFSINDVTDPVGYRAKRTYTPRIINDGSGELKMYYSAKSDVGTYQIGLATLELPIPRSADITSPDEGEEVSCLVSFDAVLHDDDFDDSVQWAVRKGTCAAGTNTVFGNVDGFHNDYDWDGADFHAATNTSAWIPGDYCFIFNPTEGTGEDNIRLTREFVLSDTIAPIVTIESPNDEDFVNGIVDIYGTIVEDLELSHYNISIYPGDADFNDFNKRLEGETKHLSTGFNNQLIYQWDTTTYNNGKYLIRLAARDKADNRDLSGNPYIGGDDSQHVIKVTVKNTPGHNGSSTDKDQCKKGRWKEFHNPSFKNQGDCVSYFQGNEKAIGNRKDN